MILYKITVRLNTIKLYFFKINIKIYSLLLHERNNSMKAQNVSIIKFLCGLMAMFLPFLHSLQSVFFDEPYQVNKIVLPLHVILHTRFTSLAIYPA